MELEFVKYQGAGNDFILLDNRKGEIRLDKAGIYSLCDRRFGIGADGLILLEPARGFDYFMRYYNSDGRESSMCGNGGRCIAAFSRTLGLWDQKNFFLAVDGPHEASRMENGWIQLKMKDVDRIERTYETAILDTGSPHLVQYADNLEQLDIVQEGRKIRNSEPYARDGINVNFIHYGPQSLEVRTYERGVEDETMACGTGVTASALVAAGNLSRSYSIPVKTQGGRLEVRFKKLDDQHYRDIWLCGPAEFVFRGTIPCPVPEVQGS